MKSNVIDGDYLEGGGQILRTALAISSIFGNPVKIEKIRHNRKVPGLQYQHLTGVNLLQDICNAKTVGASLKSVTLEFTPKSIKTGEYQADTQTAGSVCLIVQAVAPTLLFGLSTSTLTLIGGTDADFAPPVDYYREIVQHYLSKMNISIKVDTIRRGFYPKGGGKIRVEIQPLSDYVEPITLIDRGEVIKIRGTCFVAGSYSYHLAEEMKTAMMNSIKSNSKYSNIPVNIRCYKEPSDRAFGNGFGCMLVVETENGCRFGFNIVGKPNNSGSFMGDEVAKQFLELFETSNTCVDEQMQDQILLFMALARGKSSIRSSPLTKHSETCIHTIEELLPIQFDIKPVENSKDVIISCEGSGFRREN